MRYIVGCLKVVSLMAFMLAAPAALAGGSRGESAHRGAPIQRQHSSSVPEFDPAAGGAVAALIAGGGLVLAGRRNRKKA
jgi:hypothetical protein